MKKSYEGEPVKDGKYKLVQLDVWGYGRVEKSQSEAYNDMPVRMDEVVFKSLFDYVVGHWSDGFTATVKDHEITHVG